MDGTLASTEEGVPVRINMTFVLCNRKEETLCRYVQTVTPLICSVMLFRLY
jgi:hypothetical protein